MGSGINETSDVIVGGTDGTPIGNDGDALKVTGVIGEITSPLKARKRTSFVPDPSNTSDAIGEISTDVNDQLIVRSTVLTDEGSFRDDFSGTDLKTNLTGTVSVTNGSTTVTGSGTLFSSELKLRDYIKITSHSETAWAKIYDVISDTEVELEEAYTGATASAAAHRTNWITVTPTGVTNAISSGIFSVSSGTTSGVIGGIWRHGDYPPYNIQVKLKINHRRSNQEAYFGARDDVSAPEKMAQFVFDGTASNVIKCQSSSSSNAYDLEETTYIFPFTTTDVYHSYRIDLNAEKVTFTVDDTIVAVHTAHIPGPYDTINMMCLIKNTGVPAGSTDVSIDYMNWQNVDQVDIKNNFRGDQIPVTMYGLTDSLQLRHIPVNNRGHLQVALKQPQLPFYSMHTESLYPVFQSDAVYGVNSLIVNPTTSGSGSATASDSLFTVSTGTTSLSQGIIQSKARIRYRPGQGSLCRFTASFTSPVASSYQIAGMGHSEDGVYVGYKNTDFGLLYNNRGIRETRTLTITTKSSTAENITVTLNGVAFSVAVTNGASTATTAWQISNGVYAGWSAEQIGSTVVFVADSSASLNGTYSITATTAVGSYVRTKAGQAATETFVKKSDWNGDRLDGTGGSGVTIDPTKLNVFEIQMQYLGAGTITLMAEVASSSNQPELVVCHELRLPNTLTTTSFGNPSFPFTMAAYSAGSTTNLTVKSGSFAGLVEGHKILQGPRFSIYDTSTTAKQDAYYTLFSMRNTLYFGGRSNQGVVNILGLTAGVRHTDVVTIFLLRNATLVGTPSFSQFVSGSMMYIDNSATTCTFTNDKLIWSGQLGVNGTLGYDFKDDITVQPGEMITIAARTLAGTVNNLAINLNIREDQ